MVSALVSGSSGPGSSPGGDIVLCSWARYFTLTVPLFTQAGWLIAAAAHPDFCSMKRLGVFLLSLDGMLVHRRSLPRNLLGFTNNSPVHIYTPGWREAL